MLRVESVRFHYPGQSFRFDLEVAPGEVLGVLGPSGSGKSTLLGIIAGFLDPQHGRILVADRDITALPPERRPVTSMFQDHNLFPHLDVFANVALGIDPGLRLSVEARRAVADALARMQLEGLDRRLPGELSGGQRQRVALARAAVRRQPVLLLDEPLAALGPALRGELLDRLRELVAEQAMAAILISHHPDDLRRLDGRVAFVDGGKVAASGPCREILNGGAPALLDYLGREAHNS